MATNRAAQIYTVTLTSGQTVELLAEGSLYKILTSTGNVDVRRDGGSQLKGLQSGQGERAEFRKLTFTDASGGANTVVLLVGDDTFIDTRMSGDMSIANYPRATFTQTQNTVGVASGNLVAANANRKYLLIQNKGTGNIYVNLTGAACTAANGLLIEAGGSLELAAVLPTAAITAIAGVANADVIVAEA